MLPQKTTGNNRHT
uniref:Uncharacterized protein n=1 Tax=Megaselia scalaris TaxID=36166 RepID=T1GWD9_MEGSC